MGGAFKNTGEMDVRHILTDASIRGLLSLEHGNGILKDLLTRVVVASPILSCVLFLRCLCSGRLTIPWLRSPLVALGAHHLRRNLN